MSEKPGERYAFVFDLPRRAQLEELRRLVEHLPFLADAPEEIVERALWDLDCDIHTVLDSIMAEARRRNSLLTPAHVSRTVIPTHPPTTLEDLI